MNTQSFIGPSRKTGRPGSAKAAAQSPARYSQKRWQPKATAHKTLPVLSAAEQEALLRRQALALAQRGEQTGAIALFNKLLESNSNSAIDFSNRGLVYFQNGQLDQAIADYNRAIELNPRLDSAYNNRANYYAKQGRYLEAILDYDIALDLNPANIRAWINQGITFRDLEMYERALESFDLALCLSRLEGHIYAERGRTYQMRGDWNCAIADYQRALEKLPAIESAAPARLRIQVEGWLTDLLSWTFEEDEEWKLG